METKQMRLSKEQLKQIIKEELEAIMNEEVADEVKEAKDPAEEGITNE